MAKTVSKLGEEGKVSIRYESGNCMATVTPQPYITVMITAAKAAWKQQSGVLGRPGTAV